MFAKTIEEAYRSSTKKMAHTNKVCPRKIVQRNIIAKNRIELVLALNKNWINAMWHKSTAVDSGFRRSKVRVFLKKY